MNRITKTKVDCFSIEYKDWATNKTSTTSLTKWENGCGLDLFVNDAGQEKQISLSFEAFDSMVMLKLYSELNFGKEDK